MGIPFLQGGEQSTRVCSRQFRPLTTPRAPAELPAPSASAASWLEKIEQAGAGFQSLTEAIDTATPGGRMMMQIVGSFAEFERAMLRERTKSGLDAARKNGRVGGRRPKLTLQQQKEIVALVSTGQKTGADAARLFRVHPSTVVRLLAKHRLEGPASA
ncbi:recombinase family protein [Azotobacter beijerinckii]|uniref:recombinase family protein n=1 Tax=Azotobacter beijerinckii TaxID=170623 RepID=UPI001FC94349|nr:recombinase family protein [Azotobacter beijerinckii]